TRCAKPASGRRRRSRWTCCSRTPTSRGAASPRGRSPPSSACDAPPGARYSRRRGNRMSGSGDWPGDETAETRALGLRPAGRQILAAPAVVGHATLSADQLADVGGGDDVIPLLEDLERRGLVRLDERRRYSVLGGVGEQLRRTNEALATGDRLLGYFTTLARG